MLHENLLSRAVHEIIKERAAQTPDAVAVSTSQSRLTYADLDLGAARVARALRLRGVGRATVVAIVNRSLDAVIAMVGVWKAGGTCLILDPTSHPQEIPRLLTAARPRLTIAAGDLTLRLPRSDAPTVYLETLAQSSLADDPGDVPGSPAGDTVAAITCNTGPAGPQHGVVWTHAALLSKEVSLPRAGETWAMCGPLGSEPTLRRIMSTLASGGTVHVVDPADLAEANGFLQALGPVQPAVAEIPAHLAATVAAALDSVTPKLTGLRQLCVGAGEVTERALTALADACSDATVVCDYVLSDDGVVVTVPAPGPVVVAPPPAPDGQLLLLDGRLGVLGPSDGGVGEVYLAGNAAPDGYHLTAAATAARFVAAENGTRIYRTGELGRRLTDDRIELLGASDAAVVGGTTVDLRDIESRLKGAARIRDVAAAVRPVGNEDSLVAYVVAEGGGWSVADLRAHVEANLEPAAVPKVFVSLDRLPLTRTGRVDRRALPVPDPALPIVEQQYAPPRNGVEAVLVEIWAEALLLDRVGIHDDFLDIGGDSLIANQIAARIWDRFATEIPMQAFFEQCTVAGLTEEFLAGVVASESRH